MTPPKMEKARAAPDLTPPYEKAICAFSQAASHYNAASELQWRVAQRLLEKTPVAQPSSILDIGCGTGHMLAAAAARWPDAQLTGLDASQAMIAQAKARLPNSHFIHGDAAALRMDKKFDLIVSSMALHWLPCPQQALAHWREFLSPSGALCVAAPMEGSLSEWRLLCEANGIEAGLWPFLSRRYAKELGCAAEEEVFSTVFSSPQAFLKNMKTTGAATARPEHRPVPYAKMRRLLRENVKPFTISYFIAFLRFQNDRESL